MVKGIQISEKLHDALMLEKLNVGLRKKNPNVTFQEVLEDILDRLNIYLDILNKLANDHPESKVWIAKIARELDSYEYIEGILS